MRRHKLTLKEFAIMCVMEGKVRILIEKNSLFDNRILEEYDSMEGLFAAVAKDNSLAYRRIIWFAYNDYTKTISIKVEK